ncbi:MAG: HAMP domain-containing histidine kinase [Clostridiales bacterium]|nr:MAG: HAMP domain-containing histidine kinase [Clostridiales bacterium]
MDIAVIADISAESLRALADEKGIKINVNVPEKYHCGSGRGADFERGYKSCEQRCKNTAKKRRICEYFRGEKNNGKTEIAVSDNGIGISDENISKIWDRFYRADDVRNDEYGSCGLGLSMVKSIAELHGGDVSVKSELGKGTEFKIVL